MNYIKNGNFGPYTYQKEVKIVKLLRNNARRTTYEDGRKPVLIGHLTD